MNSKGGTLLIGIDDQGHALGVEKDFAVLSRLDRDGFEQRLTGLVNSCLGKEKGTLVHLTWLKHDDKDVALVRVDRSQRETYLIANPPEFYVRTGNSSQPLNVKEAAAYIRDHWS